MIRYLIEVDVTQEDIDKGCRGSKFYCPIARAFERNLLQLTEFNPLAFTFQITNNFINVTIYNTTEKIKSMSEIERDIFIPNTLRCGWAYTLLPQQARMAILKYDTNGEMKPFKFVVELKLPEVDDTYQDDLVLSGIDTVPLLSV